MARKMTGLAIAIVVAASMLLGGLGAAPATAAEVDLVEENGATTWFEGGNRTFLRFGQDAWFGVVWGTEEHPNFVYLVAIKARYLGLADVYENGRHLTDDQPVRMKVYTVYAVKLEHLIEFNDTSGDSIANYQRVYVGDRYNDSYVEAEPLLKRVSLRTAWTQSEVTRSQEGATRRWDFSLTATDLPYVTFPRGGNASGALDEVTFTFHLAATTDHVDDASVPHFRLDIDRRVGSRNVSFSRDGNVTWSGDRLRYEAKWDQRFVGWDFDPANTAPGLLLEMHTFAAFRVPLDGPDWMDRLLVSRLHEGGNVRLRDEFGERTADETDGNYAQPRRLASPSLRFGGEWSYIGDLTWVSNATADGVTQPVFAQIQGVVRASVVKDDAAYVGLVALVGMSFPSGYTVGHDPLFASDAFMPLDPTGTPRVGLWLVLALVLGVVVVVAAVAASKRKPPATPIQQAFRQEQSREEDWSQYYNHR